MIVTIDFETYSEAGFEWCAASNKYLPPHGASKKGLSIVGAARYSEHHSAEVICLAYDLADGQGIHTWYHGKPNPTDLFHYVEAGVLIEAWNVSFEYYIWQNVCVKKYGWPSLNPNQLRCAMAKSRAFGLPGSLDATAKVLKTAQKNKEGTRLIKKFSIPRDPSKNNLERNYKFDLINCEDSKLFLNYNIQDVKSEIELSHEIPDLNYFELKFWQIDQIINRRGVAIDLKTINNAINIVEDLYKKYTEELRCLTDDEISSPSEVKKIINYLNKNNIAAKSLTEESVNLLLQDETISLDCRRVLEIRQILSSASIKKLYAMKNQVCKDGRLRDLFVYHSARTGRAAGSGPQPQNLPNSGPVIALCESCGTTFTYGDSSCLFCGSLKLLKKEWNYKSAEDTINIINTGAAECLEYIHPDPLYALSGSLRSLFVAAPGKEFICSDYSAIEAVVLAELAKEKWRIDVFKSHGRIYEMSASKITGVPFSEFIEYKNTHKEYHPLRKTVGKVAELASGYGGGLGAWKNFGADKFFNEEQIRNAIKAWRKASPSIVEFWGGQYKFGRQHYYGLEGMAVLALLNPGKHYIHNGITYFFMNNILYCKLLSGRMIVYHSAKLNKNPFRDGFIISYETWNTNPKYGPIGWIRLETYGGKLTENVVQATARDILANAIMNLENAGYPIVLHVHDEIVSEVPINTKSLEAFEAIMGCMPSWAAEWPVKASDGWVGKRYRK